MPQSVSSLVMNSFSRISFLAALVLFGTCDTSGAMISLGELTKEKAAKMGIVMKSRPNGDAGTKVWLEFNLEGVLKDFSYAELRMEDNEGNHQLSAMLRVNPVHHKQPKGISSVAFSADSSQLENCEFWVVCNKGMAGIGYILKVSDFLDLEKIE